MRMRSIIATGLLLLIIGNQSYGQGMPQGKEPHKYRTIGALAGAGGGFTLGVFAGIGVFDDSINATGKVWTTALVSAAGGAVGGYFLGRMFDKRRSPKTAPPVPAAVPDEFQMSLMNAQAAARIDSSLANLNISLEPGTADPGLTPATHK